jgi:hypothetical protein
MPYIGLPFEYDTILTFAECAITAGKGWRIGAYFAQVAKDAYATIHFHTPAGKKTLYQFSSISKTGGELGITLVEGGTYSGGSPLVPWNLNRNYKTRVCLLSDVSYGTSPTTTISGGVSAPANNIGGTSGGNSKPGGSSEGGFIYLAPDEDYTLKVTSLGDTTNINALFTIGVDI